MTKYNTQIKIGCNDCPFKQEINLSIAGIIALAGTDTTDVPIKISEQIVTEDSKDSTEIINEYSDLQNVCIKGRCEYHNRINYIISEIIEKTENQESNSSHNYFYY